MLGKVSASVDLQLESCKLQAECSNRTAVLGFLYTNKGLKRWILQLRRLVGIYNRLVIKSSRAFWFLLWCLEWLLGRGVVDRGFPEQKSVTIHTHKGGFVSLQSHPHQLGTVLSFCPSQKCPCHFSGGSSQLSKNF